jgi:hypothetical protein
MLPACRFDRFRARDSLATQPRTRTREELRRGRRLRPVMAGIRASVSLTSQRPNTISQGVIFSDEHPEKTHIPPEEAAPGRGRSGEKLAHATPRVAVYRSADARDGLDDDLIRFRVNLVRQTRCAATGRVSGHCFTAGGRSRNRLGSKTLG